MTLIIGTFIILSALILAVLWARFGSIPDGVEHLKNNRQPLKGVLIFVGSFMLLVVAVALVRPAHSADFKYFQYAEAFAGVEWPIVSQSYQCNPEGPDPYTVSNGGLRLNGFIYRDFLHANLKWQHNSCAFNEDWDVRDFVGVELVIPIFDRRK
jgi:hypothetical protein